MMTCRWDEPAEQAELWPGGMKLDPGAGMEKQSPQPDTHLDDDIFLENKERVKNPKELESQYLVFVGFGSFASQQL